MCKHIHMYMYMYTYVSQNTSFKNKKNVTSSQTNASLKLWLNFHLLLMQRCCLLTAYLIDLQAISCISSIYPWSEMFIYNDAGSSGTIKKRRTPIKERAFLEAHEFQRNANMFFSSDIANKQAQIILHVWK